jgi:hypothetical protein
MPNVDSPKRTATPDDAITVASIATLAFIFADIAHEGLGHGFGFYFAGGKSSMLTTTRLIEWIVLPDPQWRISDLGGPAGNLILALFAWLGLRFFRTRPVQLRFFLWLAMAFSLFWAIGYLIFCGVTGRGDWIALVAGTKYLIFGRVLFVLVGIALYRLSIRLIAKELFGIVPPVERETKARVWRLIWISYIFGGMIASAGAILDPRGGLEILKSGALSSFGAAAGLLAVPAIFSRLPLGSAPPVEQSVSRHLAWVLAAAAASIYYIGILGPGILLWFGD